MAAPLVAAAAEKRLPIKKAVEFSMLPRTLSVAERFQLAKDAGFEEIECPTTPEQAKAEEILAASQGQRAPHPLGDELGALAQPALLERSGGGREEHGGHAHQPAQRQALGRRHRAAGARRGQSRDQLRPGVGAQPGADPQADSAGRRS